MDGRGHGGGGGTTDVSNGVPKGGDKGLPSRRVPGEGGDEDGDARALLEKARAGHYTTLFRSQYSKVPARTLRGPDRKSVV